MNAILSFIASEFYWEAGRFVPYIIWKRLVQYKNRDDVKFIVMTEPERFDLYGKHADILVPFKLKNSKKYRPNCFRLDNITNDEYMSIIKIFKDNYKDRYNILETIYPSITEKQYVNKNQYPKDKLKYNYMPRNANKEILKKYLSDKPVVILAPRYREGFRRNWPYWNELYDLIYTNTKLIDKYDFVIVGKKPDYVSDDKNRFLDVNQMEQNINTSIVGLTIECIKKAVLTVGSQSAIPNLSLLLGVEALEWGHQKHLHTVVYNVKKTKVKFIDDVKYKVDPKIIYNDMLKILK